MRKRAVFALLAVSASSFGAANSVHWAGGTIDWVVGTGPIVSDPDFNAVTNRIFTAAKAEQFLRLIIEKE